MSERLARLIILPIVTALMVGACGGDAGDGSDPVSLQLDFLMSGYHAPFVWAQADGIYARHGVTVDVREGNGSTVTAQRVATGAETYGLVDMGAAMQLIDQGAPLVALSVIVQRSPLSLLSLTSSGITRPADLGGKRIGQVGGGANAAMLPVFLRATDVPADEVRPVNVPGPSLPQALVDGSVDAMIGISNFHLPILQQKLHADVSRIDLAAYGVNVLSFALVTSRSEVDDHADRAKKVRDATVEAWESTLDDPEPALTALGEKATDLDPVVARAQLQLTTELLHTDATKDRPIGAVADDDVLESEQILVEAGLVKSATGDASRYVWHG